ncbi:BolA family transcriptional regulator [Pelagibacteraceae bacterium]|nr:BolA family transcriptional regulator [Pelagibacteraceae bacterium]
MNRMQRINKILTENFKEFSLEIIDNSHLHTGHNSFDGNNETHLKVILKSKNLQNINRLEIHKSINELVKNEFVNGLHSLEIKIN